jgi:hypothetical protein
VAQRLKDKIAHRKFLNLQATRGERATYLNVQQISLTMREAETIDAILDRASVALPAVQDLLKDYRQEHSLDGCERFEQESIGDNAVVEVVDHRCGYCCLADKLLAALAQVAAPRK